MEVIVSGWAVSFRHASQAASTMAGGAELRALKSSAETLSGFFTKTTTDQISWSVDPLAPIDLRTGIVMLLADVTRTGGWSASRDGGTGSGTRIARLRRAARWVVL